MQLLLSICIPTYNRVNELIELIDTLLTIPRDDFEIVITDNQSTDHTQKAIMAYSDPRVRYCYNEEPIPALMNTIHSMFNGRGKYILYCNDRDLLYADQIQKLMCLLENRDYSFVHSFDNCKNSGEVKEFEKGYESLLHQNLCRHPSGMVFNRQLMEETVEENTFIDLVPYVYTYDFLMLELIKYKKSALVDCCYWGRRPPVYLGTHRAGTGNNYYFFPECRERTFHKFFEYIICNDDNRYTEQQKKGLLQRLYTQFCTLFCNYKLCMSDKNETAHYGLTPEHVSTAKMLRIFAAFYSRSIERFENMKLDNKYIRYVCKQRVHCYCKVVFCCLKIDIWNMVKWLKETVDK